MLTSKYGDLNGDGIDDLMLTGASDIMCEESIGFDERGYAQTKDVIIERRRKETYFIWDTSQRRYIS
ncbi:hypothetical protein HYW94_02900 [Candidatus Uhrbacteria bacterium]|nr:hypothetical protein [Candidatus Uhrbacteria bacterium]